MKNLEKIFSRFYSKYISKKSTFEGLVEKWGEKGQSEMHKKGLSLLQILKEQGEDLKQFFSSTKEIVEKLPSLSDLKLKIYEFRRAYKEMHEISKSIWRQWIEALIIVIPLVFVLRNFVFGLYHVPTGSAEPNILVGDRIWGNKMAYYFTDVKRGDLVIFDNPEFKYERANSIAYFWQKYVGLGIPFLGLSSGPDNWVKRVIAVPGDVIEGKIEDGKTVVYRNGKKIDEPYINPYPLIRLIKSTGIFDFNMNLGLFNLLKLNRKIVDYTYDSNKELDQQPFYNMTKSEVYRHPMTFAPVFKNPYTPSHNEFGQNVDLFGPIRVPEGKYWAMGDSRKNSRDSRYWGFLDKSLIHGRASFIIYSIDSEEPFWMLELLKNPVSLWTKLFRWSRSFKSLNGKKWKNSFD